MAKILTGISKQRNAKLDWLGCYNNCFQGHLHSLALQCSCCLPGLDAIVIVFKAIYILLPSSVAAF